MPKPTKAEKRKQFAQYVEGQLRLLDSVNMRAMFGGYGLYSRGLFFGLIWEDALYLFTNEQSRKRYKRAGMEPFVFREGQCEGNYFAVPDTVLSDIKKLAVWAEEAIEARRSR